MSAKPMTQRQARAYVLMIAAKLVDSDRDQGWIRDDEHGEDRAPQDAVKIERAITDVAAMLLRMSARASAAPKRKRGQAR